MRYSKGTYVIIEGVTHLILDVDPNRSNWFYVEKVISTEDPLSTGPFWASADRFQTLSDELRNMNFKVRDH